jgi:hypothetical protein
MSTMDVSVILRLVDQLSGPAQKAAKSLRDMVSAAKQLGGLKLDQLPKVFDASANATARLQGNLKQLDVAMRGVTSNAASLNRSLAAAGNANPWRAQVAGMRQVAAMQRQLINNQGSMSHGGQGMLLQHPVIHAVGHGLREIAGAGIEYSREGALAMMAGRTPDELDAMKKRAREVAGSVPMTTEAESIKQMSEMVMAFGNLEHTMEFAEKFARVDALISAVQGHRVEGQSFHLARALEQVGATKDTARADVLLDDWAKAIVGSRGKITPEQINMSTTYMRGSKYAVGDDFLGKVMPALIMQSARASSVGNEIASLTGYIVGNRLPKEKIPDLIAAGLIDPSKVVPDKHSASKMKLTENAFYGSKDYLNNPFEWVVKYVGDMAKREGLDTAAKISERINYLFSNRMVADMVGEAVINQSQIRKDIGLFNQAPSAAEALKIGQANDWTQALSNFGAAITDFAKNITGPVIKPAIGLLNQLSAMMRTVGGSFVGQLGTLATLGGLGFMMMRSGALTALLGGGLGFMGGGPVGMLAGTMLAERLFGIGPAAAGAAAGISMLGTALGAISAVLAGLALAKWIDGTQGAKDLNKAILGDNQLTGDFKGDAAKLYAGKDGLRTWMRKQLGIPEDDGKSDPVPWGGSPNFSVDDIRSRLGMDLKPEGEKAGQSWLDAVMEVIKSLGTMSIPGPQIAPPAVPQNYQAPAPAPADQRASIGNINIHVHGSGDPHATAQAVYKQFTAAVDRHLSDGAYAT